MVIAVSIDDILQSDTMTFRENSYTDWHVSKLFPALAVRDLDVRVTRVWMSVGKVLLAFAM